MDLVFIRGVDDALDFATFFVCMLDCEVLDAVTVFVCSLYCEMLDAADTFLGDEDAVLDCEMLDTFLVYEVMLDCEMQDAIAVFVSLEVVAFLVCMLDSEMLDSVAISVCVLNGVVTDVLGDEMLDDFLFFIILRFLQKASFATLQCFLVSGVLFGLNKIPSISRFLLSLVVVLSSS